MSEFVERRSTKLIKPILFFSIEVLICFEIIYIFSNIHIYTLFLTIPVSILFIYFNSIPRLIKILNRIIEMKLRQNQQDKDSLLWIVL